MCTSGGQQNTTHNIIQRELTSMLQRDAHIPVTTELRKPLLYRDRVAGRGQAASGGAVAGGGGSASRATAAREVGGLASAAGSSGAAGSCGTVGGRVDGVEVGDNAVSGGSGERSSGGDSVPATRRDGAGAGVGSSGSNDGGGEAATGSAAAAPSLRTRGTSSRKRRRPPWPDDDPGPSSQPAFPGAQGLLQLRQPLLPRLPRNRRPVRAALSAVARTLPARVPRRHWMVVCLCLLHLLPNLDLCLLPTLPACRLCLLAAILCFALTPVDSAWILLPILPA
jgi:hypothetical protein